MKKLLKNILLFVGVSFVLALFILILTYSFSNFISNY